MSKIHLTEPLKVFFTLKVQLVERLYNCDFWEMKETTNVRFIFVQKITSRGTGS